MSFDDQLHSCRLVCQRLHSYRVICKSLDSSPSWNFFSIGPFGGCLIGHKELSSETRRAKSPATDGVFPAEPWSHHHRVSLGIHEKEEETEGSSLSSLRKKKPWKTVRKYSEENNCMVLESILITNAPHMNITHHIYVYINMSYRW